MTPYELTIAKALSPARVSYLPGSPDKRFARTICGATEITESQALYLRRMAHRYRRQLPSDVRALTPETRP
jgi:hypothetical protein